MTISPEYRAKLAAAKRGRVYTAEHRAAIGAGVRKAIAEGRGPHIAFFAAMTDTERDLYRELTNSRKYTRAEALRAIGREDLIP
jgi:hypothetical protein